MAISISSMLRRIPISVSRYSAGGSNWSCLSNGRHRR